MKVLVAGSTGALGVPLVRALAAGGHEVAGLTRNPANRDRLRALGARPLVADVMDRPGLLRYGGFYGPGPASEALVELLRRRRLPVLHGAGVISLVFIQDAVAATVAALERGRAGQAYNVVDDEPVAWPTFLRALAEAVGAPPPRELPAWLLRPANYAHAAFTTSMRVSNAKARRELGWAPSVPTWREGVPLIAAARRNAA